VKLARNLALVSTLAVAASFVAWFLAAQLKLVDPLFLPGPIEVFETAVELARDGYRQVSLWMHIAVSVGRAVFAFFIATLVGVPLGLLMGRLPMVGAVLDPFVQFLRPLPKLALIPLVVVWFGIGEFSKFFLIFLATLLTVLVAAAAAVQSVPVGRIRAAQSLGASERQLFRYVILPSAVPEISYLRTDIVMLGIVLLGTIGYFLDVALVKAQRRIVHWSGHG
jgi:taurine transport system permease protein